MKYPFFAEKDPLEQGDVSRKRAEEDRVSGMVAVRVLFTALLVGIFALLFFFFA